MLSDVKSWNLDMATPNNVGHAFIAIDVAKILPMSLFEDRMERLANELHNAKKAKNANRIYLPGELDWEKYDAASRSGKLELTEVMAANMIKLSEMFDLPLKLENI